MIADMTKRSGDSFKKKKSNLNLLRFSAVSSAETMGLNAVYAAFCLAPTSRLPSASIISAAGRS